MKNLFLGGIIVFVSISLFMVLKPPKITNYPSRGTSVIMFGDSLTKGVGATPGNDVPSLLTKETGTEIINMGVPGETSAQGLSRIMSVTEKNPKVVLVLFGGNDFLQGVSKAETFRNIDTIVTTLQGSVAVVVLLGIQGGLVSDPYKAEFQKIAKERGALYVPNILNGVFGHKDLMSGDNIHPNDAGYRKIVDKIYPVLKKAY